MAAMKFPDKEQSFRATDMIAIRRIYLEKTEIPPILINLKTSEPSVGLSAVVD
jgi:hypothetical protein